MYWNTNTSTTHVTTHEQSRSPDFHGCQCEAGLLSLSRQSRYHRDDLSFTDTYPTVLSLTTLDRPATTFSLRPDRMLVIFGVRTRETTRSGDGGKTTRPDDHCHRRRVHGNEVETIYGNAHRSSTLSANTLNTNAAVERVSVSRNRSPR